MEFNDPPPLNAPPVDERPEADVADMTPDVARREDPAEDPTEDVETRHPHKIFKPLILTLIAVIILLAVYQAGVFVGYRKATYSFRWSQNYHQMFAGPPQGFIGDVQGQAFMDAHGIFGPVLRADPTDLIIQDKDQMEKVIHIDPTTSIIRLHDIVSATSIQTNDRVVIIGQPDDRGEIDAKLIRVFPGN